MNRISTSYGPSVSIAAAIIIIASCTQNVQNLAPADHHTAQTDLSAHWGYGSDDGPNRWALLSPSYSTCGKGRRQSPIDIGDIYENDNQLWSGDYGSLDVNIVHNEHVLDIVDNGHTIQIDGDEASFLKLNGMSFHLKQVHFHTPSEHTIDGRRYPMEMHLVHQNDSGKFAVLAVLFKEGRNNSNYDFIIENLPYKPGEKRHIENVSIDIDALLPKKAYAYSYSGSLTTPPCLEGVYWLVAVQHVQLSSDQLNEFKRRLHQNNRPTQPLNKRKVTLIQGNYLDY